MQPDLKAFDILHRATDYPDIKTLLFEVGGEVKGWYPNNVTDFITENIRKKCNLLKPTGYVMHHQFNIQQLYALPTLYLCVLYLSENKQRLVPLTA